jgi:hypothetical protein
VKVHALKTDPLFFRPIAAGDKTFELRVNDRDYKVGDFVVLREFIWRRQQYSGSYTVRQIAYILKGAFQEGLGKGWVIFQMKKMPLALIQKLVKENFHPSTPLLRRY